MMTDVFSTLLQELGELIKINDLHPDSNNSCLIKLPNGLEIQLEPDARAEFLIIGTTIGTAPPGRYRESIFREALKANGMPLPRYGIFSFSKKSDKLILFDTLHLKDLSGLKIFDFLKPFAEKAHSWKSSIAVGEIPSIIGTYANTTSHAGMFGMK